MAKMLLARRKNCRRVLKIRISLSISHIPGMIGFFIQKKYIQVSYQATLVVFLPLFPGFPFIFHFPDWK